MFNFQYYAPTKVVFGKATENQVGSLVKEQHCKKVLIHYGGGSVKRSGLLDRVKASLEAEGIAYVELGGVVPNPRLDLVYQGIDLCKKEGVDFILAVGGGSVIDSAKAVALGARMQEDIWSVFERKCRPTEALPVGCVLTMVGTGSEMNAGAVITNQETKQKIGHVFAGEAVMPKFSILNPVYTLTLPHYQMVSGIYDIFNRNRELKDPLEEAEEDW